MTLVLSNKKVVKGDSTAVVNNDHGMTQTTVVDNDHGMTQTAIANNGHGMTFGLG